MNDAALSRVISEAERPRIISEADLRRIGTELPLAELMRQAAALRDEAHGIRVSYSRKVFIPLTRLCRDTCRYCTFATTPRHLAAPYLSRAEVIAIARAGEQAGCKEALFTLGDNPESRYRSARAALDQMGFASTIDYLAAMCQAVLDETGLLPHVNPGVMTEAQIAQLRKVSVSQGLMLESSAARLCERGGPHHGAPDKQPALRLAVIEAAGRQQVPFTSGILIGIGETREERLDALFALRALHLRYGHLQEIIVQNFRAKAGTPMNAAAEPEFDDLAWTVAMARIIFGGAMNIQVPPNLSPDEYAQTIDAGINDWGGVSPVTPDHVNPEAPWPQLDHLAERTGERGKLLVERLATYPAWCREADRWHHAPMAARIRGLMDTEGYARTDPWAPGRSDVALPVHASALGAPVVDGHAVDARSADAHRVDAPVVDAAVADAHVTDGPVVGGSLTGAHRFAGRRSPGFDRLIARAERGERLPEEDIERLFAARGDELEGLTVAADALRRAQCGDRVGYVVNRNINYTNVCTYRCRFCAFSKGRGEASARLRGEPYDLSVGEIQRRVHEAWQRGATEVCMQGGIHPDYSGHTYLAIVRAVKEVEPRMHVHAFSPLEVTHGATTLGLSLSAYLEQLRDAGLGSLPGTAAEILDDSVRRVICPDKINTGDWVAVMEAAHAVGLRATATIMYGHMESARHWARHLLVLRDLQARTGVFTEFVPLPFVHMEAPLALRGAARHGPTWREALLMHSVARLVLHPLVQNIQASWVKLGPQGVAQCLQAGANDLGGTLMNESISRAAGTEHGQELAPSQMDALIQQASRVPMQRTTLYAPADPAQVAGSYAAASLTPLVQERAGRHARIQAPAGQLSHLSNEPLYGVVSP